MRKTKREKLEAASKLFHQEKVLKIDSLLKLFETESRRTVHRYMKELEYRTSYSHAGQYYTLLEIAEFDVNGLWHYGDIGFSRFGTLVDTIVHFVYQSPEGMTNNELQGTFQLVVKAALIDLVKKNMVVREKRENKYVYLSPDPTKRQKQLKQRDEFSADYLINDSISMRVLLMAYKLVGASASSEQIAAALKKEGSKISLKIVRRVLQLYGVDNKKKLRFSTH